MILAPQARTQSAPLQLSSTAMASSARFLLATTCLVMCVVSESFAVVPAATALLGESSPNTGFLATSAAPARGMLPP